MSAMSSQAPDQATEYQAAMNHTLSHESTLAAMHEAHEESEERLDPGLQLGGS